MKYYIGMDIGTSSTKAVLFDRLGHIHKTSSYEYDIITPKNGYAEEDPNDWKNAAISVLKDIALSVDPDEIRGIGLSGQMHGLVLLDKDDNILRNSIIWCDNRTVHEALEIKAFGEDKIREITGNNPMPAFTLAKLLWVKNNEPDIYKQIDKVMLPKDYIRYVLTGQFKTEYSDASGMQMVDLKNECYSDEILTYFGIDRKILPEIVESADITGTILEKISEETGIKTTTFVVGGAGDQAASAIGNGIVGCKDVSITLGSSGVVFASLKDLEIKNNGLQYFHHALPHKYHTMGVTNGCGNSLKWYKENLCQYEASLAKADGLSSYDYITRNIDNIPAGCNGLIYLPYLMGERTPNLDPNATGMFIGIRNNTTKDMMTKAVIEGISYSMKDCYSLLGFTPSKVLISGGGARNPKWCRILASMLNHTVSRVDLDEAGALGVAILAMVADNIYSDVEDACKKIITLRDSFEPRLNDYRAYLKYFEVYKMLYKQNKILFEMEKEIK